MSQEGLAACVRSAQGGSLRDFEILVHRFQDMAVGYSRVLLNDFHLAEDAAQDAFVQAYTRLGQLQNAAAFPGWFRQIVFSCCMRYRHRRAQGRGILCPRHALRQRRLLLSGGRGRFRRL